MSKKFYAVHRETGEHWKPDVKKKGGTWEHQYLVMYDSGYLAVVSIDFYTHIEPLDTKLWKKVVKQPRSGSEVHPLKGNGFINEDSNLDNDDIDEILDRR